ncbi:hypothetical protein NSK_002364 [Nannochloropsis salina CCMP1776]|jgi:NAD(P)-dependent dehydrogenase (short-subunit alcohol dehydrogenase family)|uniref:Uncharacterized protein n=1 Tax=Nannochloropsis salina CCMP1776 TaxID=1027361 RepID=A0A4D9D429_9STRA|nr:hypothetical protein NSK_002364 [Nannochloropsis salina CCMP1776]|eukprot:TFJ86156.1 hypothetical protein NSK_002364 [Nannochloropsis salina CCMP1776]
MKPMGMIDKITPDLLRGVALGLLGAFVLAIMSYHLTVFIFRKRFPVPPKGGAIVITGASTGIGNHAAQYLARQGYIVYCTVRKPADVEAIQALGLPNLRPIIMDVAQAKSIENGAETILADLSKDKRPLIGLVNNAGVAQKFPLEFHPLTDLRSMFDIHVIGPLELTQRLLPAIRASKGRIVNLSSITALVLLPTGAAYGASKLAVEGISDGLRRELVDFDCSVSIVQPAYVNTAIFKKVTQSIDTKVEVSPEIMSTYGYFFRTEKRIKDRAAVDKASPPSVTTDAITHALTSPYPHTRYIVANVSGIPAFWLGWLVWLCPDRLADFIMGKFS